MYTRCTRVMQSMVHGHGTLVLTQTLTLDLLFERSAGHLMELWSQVKTNFHGPKLKFSVGPPPRPN